MVRRCRFLFLVTLVSTAACVAADGLPTSGRRDGTKCLEDKNCVSKRCLFRVCSGSSGCDGTTDCEPGWECKTGTSVLFNAKTSTCIATCAACPETFTCVNDSCRPKDVTVNVTNVYPVVGVPIELRSQAVSPHGEIAKVTWSFGDEKVEGDPVTRTFNAAGRVLGHVQVEDEAGLFAGQGFEIHVCDRACAPANACVAGVCDAGS